MIIDAAQSYLKNNKKNGSRHHHNYLTSSQGQIHME